MLKHRRTGVLLAALLFAIASAPLSVTAAMIYLGPRFDDAKYWDTHVIYLARITDIKYPPNGHGPYETTFVPTQIISGTVDPTNRTISSNPGDLMVFGPTGEQPPNFPVGVFQNSLILVSESTEYHQVTVVRVMESSADQPLLIVLERIAALRKTAMPALLSGAMSEFDLISQYCLNELLKLPDATISDADLKQLQIVADDNERPPELRIAAEQAFLKFSGVAEPDREGAERDWLWGIIQTANRSADIGSDSWGYSQQMQKLIYKLLEFKTRREETTDEVLRLMADQKAPVELRRAAGSALSGWDQSIFNFQKPDAQFERMFETYAGLLQDKVPDLRILGVSLLFDRTLRIMSMMSPPEQRNEYAQRAVRAVQDAISRETDSQVMVFFKSRLEIYGYQSQHRELEERIRRLETNPLAPYNH